ncbi:MAG: hypothetical protein FJ290_16865 [Planctomycetes bacterium]|nr:hypothetical protein [Planctomycetota bacterium]
MKRFKLVAYYEDKDTHSRVAQALIVLAQDVKGAVAAAKSALGPRALGGHILAIEVKESDEVEAGVVYTGEPYLPLNWPLDNVGQRAPAAGSAPRPAARPPEADGGSFLTLDDFIEPT